MEDLVLQHTEVDRKLQKRLELKKRLALVKVPEPKIRVLSLGWGVQSFTLAAMSALGDLPKLDLLIHADTSWERQHTKDFITRWLPWLEEKGMNYVSACALSARYPEKDGSRVHVPAFLVNKRGKVSKINRQCTSKWKIAVVKQLITQELKFRHITKRPGAVEQWLGISWDEASRAKSSDVTYINIRHPYLEAATRMTRQDCVNYLLSHDIEVPGKSACTHCVFHSQRMWEEMKRTNGPDWKEAVGFDESIRGKSTKYNGLFVHRSVKPLPMAVLLPEDEGYTAPEMFDGPGCDSAGYCWD